MPYDYSEDQLMQRSIAEFVEKELGWKSVYAFDQEVLGDNASERCVSLGCTSYHEVLLIRHFCKALKNLNPWFTDKQLQEVVERMTERMSSQTLMQINEQKYQYIRDGVPVTCVKPNGETEEARARVIDFNAPDKNEFLCVRELWVYGSLYRRRADIVGFVKENLSKEDIKKLKEVAKDLLEKIKEQLADMDHPFDKSTTKATLYIIIRDLLYQELPESYSDESISYYRDAVYDYVSRQYGGAA